MASTKRMNGGATSPKIVPLPSAMALVTVAPTRCRNAHGTASPEIDRRASALAHWPKENQLGWSRPRIAAIDSERAWYPRVMAALRSSGSGA